VAMQAGAVQPLITIWAAVEQPAIAHHRIDHTQFGATYRGAGDIARSRTRNRTVTFAAEFWGGIGYIQC
jgi:hypothetical protein